MSNNYELARARMVREQLIPRDITDQRVLQAMGAVPRHLFVEDALQSQAYGDFPLPIGEGQTISQPYIVALMTQALGLQGHEKVLEIGTGCGYQSAVLASLCDRLYTVERIKNLHIKARRIFDRLKLLNIMCKIDDGTLGWPEHGPYDAIMVTASGPQIPSPLLEQLADPGRLVIPVGDRVSQDLLTVTKIDGVITETCIEKVRFVSLIGSAGWAA
ncbi:MAG: protein-L-isoaspartate(D-aspartate) O-methyltransferase [Proteobacteria bacterium]|nr:protein-L-isoaspartate(D-aspartate) O-methyltransferase [Pseudomonadota bacterium]MBU4294255.1 protein-L-isoaspartate(D-aspartate) O-methyltransferase [Pseudomonadota bacterium]MCG2748768.1 protein-L-isoaspartate(D-aspartate) O-methyltransferase [Desulfobulbaceae bacterium]